MGVSIGTTLALIKKFGGGGSVDPQAIAEAVDSWCDENITNPDSPPLDRSLTGSSAAAPADLVGDLKNDIDILEPDANASDVGKALIVKTVSGGKAIQYEFGEVGEPDPEVIEQAVSDWLDDHPEATTTVEDGSLTEEKLTSATLAVLKNNYVTPEMFGAKGDGETDDTLAINSMLASGNKTFSFANKTYLVDGSIDVSTTCEIYFDHTVLKAKSSSALRDFEYVIGFNAMNIKTYGKLTVKAQTSVNIGIWISGAGRSSFDELQADNARIWGVCYDRNSNAQNSISFNRIDVAQNGFKVHGKAKYVSSNTLAITNISGSLSGYSLEVIQDLFGNTYNQAQLLIDDSGYTRENLHNRLVYYHEGNAAGYTIDTEDPTKATFVVNTNGPNVKSDFADGENGRDVFIPIGGGICVTSKNSEGVFNIGRLFTQTNPIGAYLNQGYGGTIGQFLTEYDTIVMHNECMVTHIDYMYCEAIGNGYKYTYGNGFDRITLFRQTTNGRCYVANPFVGASRKPFMQGNCVINYKQLSSVAAFPDVLVCSNYLSAKKTVGCSMSRSDNVFSMDVDEYTPRNITVDANGYAGSYSVKLNLADVNAVGVNIVQVNTFEPITFYIRRRRVQESDYNAFKITLHSDLISAGYTINGAVDNVLTIAPYSFGNYVKITIMLFAYAKKFFVTAEQLTFVDNTTT